MKSTHRSAVLTVALLYVAFAQPTVADTFGISATQFDIEFVTIGNPGNAPDTQAMECCDSTIGTSGHGSVPYTYRIAKHEISEQMIEKANVLGALAITKDNRGPNKPAHFVTWNEAARFVNWLNTSSGSPPAYKFAIQPGEVGYNANADIQLWTPGDAGYNPNNLFRNSLARYFLPGAHEWYKAAYYDPTNAAYYYYPTGSISAPTPVASGTAPSTAVYEQTGGLGPADITVAGGLSPYGTMAQGGNSWEWEETSSDLTNASGSSPRGVRGGVWFADSRALRATWRLSLSPSDVNVIIGIRVASVPETTGDFNSDGTIDAADYVVWRKGLAVGAYMPNDYNTWRANFGATAGGAAAVAQLQSQTPAPEPSTMLLAALSIAAAAYRRRAIHSET